MRNKMKIYPELKKVAALNDKICRLVDVLQEKIDIEGLYFQEATLITGCKEKNGHLYQDGVRLDNGGITDNEYYCLQYTGYCEDDFYGTLYFKTDVQGSLWRFRFICDLWRKQDV